MHALTWYWCSKQCTSATVHKDEKCLQKICFCRLLSSSVFMSTWIKSCFSKTAASTSLTCSHCFYTHGTTRALWLLTFTASWRVRACANVITGRCCNMKVKSYLSNKQLLFQPLRVTKKFYGGWNRVTTLTNTTVIWPKTNTLEEVKLLHGFSWFLIIMGVHVQMLSTCLICHVYYRHAFESSSCMCTLCRNLHGPFTVTPCHDEGVHSYGGPC